MNFAVPEFSSTPSVGVLCFVLGQRLKRQKDDGFKSQKSEESTWPTASVTCFPINHPVSRMSTAAMRRAGVPSTFLYGGFQNEFLDLGPSWTVCDSFFYLESDNFLLFARGSFDSPLVPRYFFCEIIFVDPGTRHVCRDPDTSLSPIGAFAILWWSL